MASSNITELIAAARRGDAAAEANLISSVYDQLHRLAAGYMRRERQDHTLQPTALLNETWLRLMSEDAAAPKDRVHFFSKAATVMRLVLVDHARRHNAAKRTGGLRQVELEDFLASASPRTEDLLILDEALTRLAEWDARQARLVELVYFGGLTLEEAGGELGVSERTAKRDWRAARAWLQAQLRS